LTAPASPRRRRTRRFAIAVAFAWVVLAAAGAAAWRWSLPAAPGPFYAAPARLPDAPGALIRHEPFARAIPAGARGFKLLYATTRHDGTPAVASAILLVPAGARPGPWPLVAWTHGTAGVAPGCAPSLSDDPFQHVPGLPELLAAGFAWVGTDYVGLGTSGPHPYLVGEGEARSALDAIRAARQVPGIVLDERTVVWGYSQGGHAALWTGALAASYAPDLELAGVAAAAPASRIDALLAKGEDSAVMRIMSSYLVVAYAAVHPDVEFDAYVRPGARWLVREIARRCLSGPAAFALLPLAFALGGPIFAATPTSGSLGRRLDENVPRRAIAAPLVIAQGLADALVLPDVQAGYADERCTAGQPLAYWTYAGRDHLSLVAPASPLGRDLVAWSADRFAGDRLAGGCRRIAR
jgi:hypothetical protein